jgi:hypothetical protein
MADKYLPQQKELLSLNDDDLFYLSAGGDYKINLKYLRQYLNPVYSTDSRIVSYTVPIEGCYGNWYSNSGAFATISFGLPFVQDGLYAGFLVETAKNMLVTPRPADIIIGLTDYNGQSIRSNSVGSSIVLRATGNNWHVSRLVGTWIKV